MRVCLHCGLIPVQHSRTQFCSDHCRFWHKVDKRTEDECWMWLGTTPAFGHGQFRYQGGVIYAHRYSWEERHGPLDDGYDTCVLHKCDVPACVNPKHLFVGTRKENLADMRRKGRGHNPPLLIGEANPQTTLTEKVVREIKAAVGSPKDIAARFGIPRRVYYKIRAGETWRHVS